MTGNRLKLNNDKTKLFRLDLVKGSACHKITTWELAIMIFPSKAMSKISGSTLTQLCLWWSILTTSVVQHISRSEDLAVSAISWRRRHLFGWCVLLFSVSWTTATLCSLTSTGCKKKKKKKNQNRAAKVVFRRADMSMLDHCSRHFTGCQSKTGLFLR